MLSLAAAAVLAADDGHDHGESGSGDSCSTYEWGAIFAMPTTNSEVYTWTAYKTGTPLAFAEANMKVVFLPVADAAEATLTAAIAEAVDGMGHTPCTDVEPGETIVPGEHKCSLLHFEGDDVTKVSYNVSTAELSGYVAIFTQHNPSEFEVVGGHYLTTGTTDVEAAFSVGAQVCSPPAAPSLPPPDSGSDDSPCFSDSATACHLADETLPPATAFALCFGGETAADGAANAAGADGADGTAVARGRAARGGAAAARVAMRDLKAGDLVLSSPAEVARVIVNQHAKVELTSAVLLLEHDTGSLALTPDHVLWVDGAFRAASEVQVGSVLDPHTTVTKVAAATHAVVNPLTTRGTILAAGPTGSPVVASVFPDWIASLLHGSSLPYPLPLSAAAAASYLFPASVQAYYDAQLEPFFASNAQSLKDLKAAVPSPVALGILATFDGALVAGLGLWGLGAGLAALVPALMSVKGVVALVAIGMVAKARKDKARTAKA